MTHKQTVNLDKICANYVKRVSAIQIRDLEKYRMRYQIEIDIKIYACVYI